MEEGDQQDSQGDKFIEKMKKNPMMPVGIIGVASIATYGLYNFRKNRTLSPSIYLIQLRLAAQGTLLSCLSIGIVYSLFKNKKVMKFFGMDTSSSTAISNDSQ